MTQPRRTAGPSEPSLSPSLHHRWLLDRTRPALAFAGGEVRAWQRKLRRRVRQRLGLPTGPRGPLRVHSLWCREHELGSIEKVQFTAEPRAEVTAYVCLPRGATPPYSWFVCLQGHSTGAHVSIAVERDDETRFQAAPGDRDFGLGCMARGVAALCVEQRAFGQRRERCQEQVAPHGCHDAAMHALMLGRTLVGERVFDVDRGLDYLQTRSDVDWKRIGVMGNSGGGTTSLFAAAVLPRLRFAMPSCYFCTFRDSIMSIYHCADNYVPGLLLDAEMADVMGLFAPRPVVLVAGLTDEIFPIAGVRRAFRHLKAIYRAAGAPKACQLVVGPEGHRFYAEAAWAKMLPLLKRG